GDWLTLEDILRALKSGTANEAYTVCDSLESGDQETFGTQQPLARLRILAVWISRSSQRRKQWKRICTLMNLATKYIEYDVDTRWNSTFRMLEDALNAQPQVDEFFARIRKAATD
ncbi:hypothetical protein LIPSTDRAFT_73083, partial [Lipomyces starkeyi NRRL Y-11557]